MPADFVINEDLGVVFSRGCGELTYADAAGHMSRLMSDARFRPDFRQIFDFRDAAPVQITSMEILQLAEHKIFGPDSRRAFVVASDLQYGLCRMFGMHREIRGEPSIKIFRDLPGAITWIGVPAEATQQAFSVLEIQMAGKTASRKPRRQPPG